MRYQVQENCLTIYLPREVDHHNADEIRKEADAVISRNHIRYVIFDLHTDKLLHISYHISVYSTFNVWNDCNYRGLPSNQQFSLLISYLILVSCLYNDLLYLIHKLIGFLGCGNMGGAIARAVCKAADPKKVYLANRTTAKAQALAKELGCKVLPLLSRYNSCMEKSKPKNFCSSFSCT